MDLGEDPTNILADAYRVRANAGSPSNHFRLEQTQGFGRVDSYNRLHKIQDIPNDASESLPSWEEWIQVQITWHCGVCFFLTDDSR